MRACRSNRIAKTRVSAIRFLSQSETRTLDGTFQFMGEICIIREKKKEKAIGEALIMQEISLRSLYSRRIMFLSFVYARVLRGVSFDNAGFKFLCLFLAECHH